MLYIGNWTVPTENRAAAIMTFQAIKQGSIPDLELTLYLFAEIRQDAYHGIAVINAATPASLTRLLTTLRGLVNIELRPALDESAALSVWNAEQGV